MIKWRKTEKSDYDKLVEEVIYNLMYERSIVDGVRIIHEDQWPVEELAKLFTRNNAMNKAISDLFPTPHPTPSESRKENE